MLKIKINVAYFVIKIFVKRSVIQFFHIPAKLTLRNALSYYLTKCSKIYLSEQRRGHDKTILTKTFCIFLLIEQLCHTWYRQEYGQVASLFQTQYHLCSALPCPSWGIFSVSYPSTEPRTNTNPSDHGKP